VSDGRLAAGSDDGHVQVIEAGGDGQGHVEQLPRRERVLPQVVVQGAVLVVVGDEQELCYVAQIWKKNNGTN
jgi:hypothetical protein